MSGTLAVRIPRLFARMIPPRGVVLGPLALLPHDILTELREHALMIRLVQVFSDALRRMAPDAWRQARREAARDDEAERMVANAELPGVMPVHVALDALGMRDPQRL